MKKIIGAASVVTAMFLSGCAGRSPQPVAVVQPQDRYADCAAISIEVQANNQKIGDLGGEEGGKVAQNDAGGNPSTCDNFGTYGSHGTRNDPDACDNSGTCAKPGGTCAKPGGNPDGDGGNPDGDGGNPDGDGGNPGPNTCWRLAEHHTSSLPKRGARGNGRQSAAAL
jgi:hypothetical protein